MELVNNWNHEREGLCTHNHISKHHFLKISGVHKLPKGKKREPEIQYYPSVMYCIFVNPAPCKIQMLKP